MEKRYCGHCEGWYLTGVDQCDISIRFEDSKLENITGVEIPQQVKEYGIPSELNKKNDCPHYREISLLQKVARRIHSKVPLNFDK